MSNDSNDIVSKLFDAVMVTFEEMTFMEVMETDEAYAEDEMETLFWATVELKNPPKGSLTIIMCEDLSHQITENLFGNDDPEESFVKDVVAEVTNTIAGRLMGSIVPEDTAFEIGIPETGRGWKEAGPDQTAYAYNLTEEYLVMIIIDN